MDRCGYVDCPAPDKTVCSDCKGEAEKRARQFAGTHPDGGFFSEVLETDDRIAVAIPPVIEQALDLFPGCRVMVGIVDGGIVVVKA